MRLLVCTARQFKSLWRCSTGALAKAVPDEFAVGPDQPGPADEDTLLAFRRALSRQLQFRGFVVGFVALVVALSVLCQVLAEEQASIADRTQHNCVDAYAWSRDDPRTAFFAALLSLQCICIVFVIVSLVAWCVRRVQAAINWEKLYCVAACCFMGLLPLASNDWAAEAIGQFFVGYQHRPKCPHTWRSPGEPRADSLWLALCMDAVITVSCMYVPICFVSSVLVFCSGLLGLATVFLFQPDEGAKSALPALLFFCLGLLACGGAHDKASHRWRAWTLRTESLKSTVLASAMMRFAKTFCDVVISLTGDLELVDPGATLGSLLGERVEGCRITERMSATDAARFLGLLAQTRRLQVPASAAVTLRGRGGQPVEANVLVVHTESFQAPYVVGVSQLREQTLPEVGVVCLAAPRYRGGGSEDRRRSEDGQDELMGPRHTARHEMEQPCDALCSQPTAAAVMHAALSLGSSGRLSMVNASASAASREQISAQRLDSNRAESTLFTEQAFCFMEMDQIESIGEVEHWLLPTGAFEVDRNDELGRGGFGVTYGGTLCGSQIAAKFPLENVKVDEFANLKFLRAAASELRILRQVRHPNIVLFHGAAIAEGVISLVLEKVKGQVLSQFWHAQRPKRWQEAINLDVCSALWYLHSHVPRIVHGDLKPGNIMIEMRYPGIGTKVTPHPKLIDFGLSRILSPRARSLGGTVPWLAPEVIKGNASPAPSADMFAFGCVMFFVLTSSVPFGLTQEELQERAKKGSWPRLTWPASAAVPPAIEQLCERCCSMDASSRPGAAEMHRLMSGALRSVVKDMKDDEASTPATTPPSDGPGKWVQTL